MRVYRLCTPPPPIHRSILISLARWSHISGVDYEALGALVQACGDPACCSVSHPFFAVTEQKVTLRVYRRRAIVARSA
jgi:hypothetical protein